MDEKKKLNELDQSFTALCELKGKEISVVFWKMYRKALLDVLTIDQAIQAIEIAFSRKTYGFPQPADLIEFIKGNGESEALEAWELILQAFSRCGAYGSPLFADPKIPRVIDILGGWIKLCSLEGKEIDICRAQFLKAHRELPSGGEPRALMGLVEQGNRASGHIEHIPDSVLIGDSKNHLKLIREAM